MATKKDLQILLNDIAELTEKATSKQEAVDKGLDSYLYLDYANVYGGYRLVSVKISNGAHCGALGMSSIEPRLKAKEMFWMLRGILTGLEANIKHYG